MCANKLALAYFGFALGSRFKKATLLRPDAAPQTLEAYDVEEGTGIDIASLGAFGALVLEP
ncbi:MAG TPA: hypothetical protein VMT15_02405 [Bryobacteraceae bacterium]|nr:hypothetical protein [Bryobacteraceae bacterium]